MRTSTKVIAIALSSRVPIFAVAMTVHIPVGPMLAAPVAGTANGGRVVDTIRSHHLGEGSVPRYAL